MPFYDRDTVEQQAPSARKNSGEVSNSKLRAELVDADEINYSGITFRLKVTEINDGRDGAIISCASSMGLDKPLARKNVDAYLEMALGWFPVYARTSSPNQAIQRADREAFRELSEMAQQQQMEASKPKVVHIDIDDNGATGRDHLVMLAPQGMTDDEITQAIIRCDNGAPVDASELAAKLKARGFTEADNLRVSIFKVASVASSAVKPKVVRPR